MSRIPVLDILLSNLLNISALGSFRYPRLWSATTVFFILVHTNMTTVMWAEVRYLSAVAIFPSVGRHLEPFYGEVASTAGLRMHSSSSFSFILVESFAIILLLC